jgi:hypothetical protein
MCYDDIQIIGKSVVQILIVMRRKMKGYEYEKLGIW